MNGQADTVPRYAELHCLSHFSFLRGASKAEELFATATALGYDALAITDECSFAGLIRALQASEKHGLKLICGTELRLVCGLRCVLLAPTQSAYTQISALITHGRIEVEKGTYRLTRADLESFALDECLVLWLPPPAGETTDDEARWIAAVFPQRAWLAVELHRGPDDAAELAALLALGAAHDLPCVAAGDVHMHVRERRALQDAVTAIRHSLPLHECGTRLFPNGERHLRPYDELAEIYPRALLEEAAALAARCTFDLRQLKYEYPDEIVPGGYTHAEWLRKLTLRGLRRRWPHGTPAKVAGQIEFELALIAKKQCEAFFLTVYNIVRYARRRKILCQGRGSAANSAVCYALGITEVNPAEQRLLFGRFMSEERQESPDIDVDFEHDRREEVMQYVFRKYGRQRAALAATVIRYRPKSALRDVGKVLGIGLADIDRLSRSLAWWDNMDDTRTRLGELGFDPESPRVRAWLGLANELIGAPRHLSQHVGGFVISDAPVSNLVPIENATMPDRTVIQWDKDDLEYLGLLKVDCLALGMLSAIRRSLEFTTAFADGPCTMADIKPDDQPTYAMIREGDTVGVFQIESRAQMSMLPRLKPRNFYDLVIQIAIVRPGPIQGGMVHPYLKRRQNPQAVEYPSEALKSVLGRTLGVPLFQEQVIEIAQVAADFTEGEADQLRRSMAAWKRDGGLEPMEERLISGMLKNGYTREFAGQIFEMVRGFGSYGFPESHSASFAKLAYLSAWLKRHRPAAFFAGLVNSQPMGFYAPAQLIREARRAGVDVRPVDVMHSEWDCTLENDPACTLDDKRAIRLGFRIVGGFDEASARRIIETRRSKPFVDVSDFAVRTALDEKKRNALVHADALIALAGHRHTASWQVQGVESLPGFLASRSMPEPALPIAAPHEAEDILADYRTTGLTLRRHPLALLRPRLRRLGVKTAEEVSRLRHGANVRVAGIVLHRQRPPTAKGTLFITLEDETGVHNLIVHKSVFDEHRHIALGSRLLVIDAKLQKIEKLSQLIAQQLENKTSWIGSLNAESRDFR